MNKPKYTLCICFPTYNRGKVLTAQIKEYFSKCPDSRFCIRVQDNCSTDGSFELLQTITDSRFLLYQNKENVGGIQNSQIVLYNNSQSAYVLYLIDRDIIKPEYISSFLDYLEINQPWGGYVKLRNNQANSIIQYKAGVEGLQYMGYLSKHPTGYFWRSDWITNQMDKHFFKNLPPKFDFWFDIISAHCAVQHPTNIINIPVVKEWWESDDQEYVDRLTDAVTYYNKTNFFALPHKRQEYFEIYIKDLLTLDIPAKVLPKISSLLLYRTMYQITIGLQNLYHNNWLVYHYNLEWQHYPIKQQLLNMMSLIKKYHQLLAGHDSILYLRTFTLASLFLLKILKKKLNDLINPPIERPHIPGKSKFKDSIKTR